MSTPTHSGNNTPEEPYGSRTDHVGEPESTVQQPYGQHQSYGQNQPYGQQNQPYGQGQYGQTMPSYDQNTYGQQYGQGQYGQAAYGQAPTGQMPQAVPFASYGARAGAYLLDGLLSVVPLIVLGGLGLWLAVKDTHEVASSDPYDSTTDVEGFNAGGFALMGLSLLVCLLFQAWNRGSRQGKTGQSIGKKIMKIQVVDERTGQPAGTGAGLGRFGIEFVFGIVNSFVGVLSIVDLLWPLWDAKKQSLHDEVVHTVVVSKPQG